MEKTCDTCVFFDTPKTTVVCQTCLAGGVIAAPHWRGATGQGKVAMPPEGQDPSKLAPVKSDGSTASYYVLPEGAKELQDLISYRDMNSQVGEIFRACYRYGIASHSDRLRDAKKIKFYAEAEIARLEKYGG
jgi:hypothetical protein